MKFGANMENIEMEFLNRQDDKKKSIYRLADHKGEGEMIPWMRYAMKTGDTSFVDGYLETKIQDFMYNGGKGKLQAVAELVKIRNKERNERLSAFARKKGKGKDEPNILVHFDQQNQEGDLMKALKRLEGGTHAKGDAKYREIVWKIEERGLSPLHQAIVNEDPHLVLFLLRNGAKVDQRCFGAFFCPDDQKASRTDSLEHEWVEVSLKTNYKGRMYLGEYPLAFAASINQADCYKILRAHKADPNLKDTNGNTVLHMIVIHDRLEMLELAYKTGAKLNIANAQHLTPLTMAAKMAKRRMFEEILQLECNVVWSYGDALSISYPLAKLDTIDEENGNLNEDSALSLVVYGETDDHLEMLEGLIEDILDAKWKHFGKRRWIINMLWFFVYWLFVCTAFMTRPFEQTTDALLNDQTFLTPYNENSPTCSWQFIDAILLEERHYHELESCTIYHELKQSITRNHDGELVFEKHYEKCHLINYFDYGYQGYVRVATEPVVWLSALYQVVHEIIKIYHMGYRKYFSILKSFPEKILYEVSLLIILIMPFVRGLCLATRSIKFVGPFIVMLYTIVRVDVTRFFIIYMIFLIGFSQGLYIVFLSCQRQYYKDLLALCTMTGKNFEGQKCLDHDDGNATTIAMYSMKKSIEWNLMHQPIESLIWSFISTFTEGAKLNSVKLYKRLNTCPANTTLIAGKIIFVVFLFLAFIVLFHLFIAMLERTYETIFEKQNKEYKRQWAQAILLLELSLTPKDRLIALMKYTKPIGTNKKRRAFVVSRKHVNLTETEKIIREQKLAAQMEEKRAYYKKRLKDITYSMSKFFKELPTNEVPLQSILKESGVDIMEVHHPDKHLEEHPEDPYNRPHTSKLSRQKTVDFSVPFDEKDFDEEDRPKTSKS